jgi:hypothetical protein
MASEFSACLQPLVLPVTLARLSRGLGMTR